VSFAELLRRRASEHPRRIVLPEGNDPRVAAAALRLRETGLAHPLLLGSADDVEAAWRAAGGRGAPPSADPAQDERLPELAERLHARRAARGLEREEAGRLAADPLLFGALLVAAGEADGSVAGAVRTTAEVLRSALWAVGPAPGLNTVSSSFYMAVRDFRGAGEEVLTFTDAGVVPDPDADQLAEIALAACEARRLVVGDEPRVAFLSYSTHGSAGGASVEKVRSALEGFRRRAPRVLADGELQADAALIAAIGERKAPGSPVAGRANVLVFPDLDAGNIAYKLVERLAGATALGPVLQGLARPCNDLSRGASVDDIVLVSCITGLMAGDSRGRSAGGEVAQALPERGTFTSHFSRAEEP
jgi:phosphate acetyltransferase